MAILCVVLSIIAIWLAVRSSKKAAKGKEMEARFGGNCLSCQGRIEVGTRMRWLRKGEIVHLDCAAFGQAENQRLFDQALEKIEAAKGPVARANATRNALEKISDHLLKDRLLLEASRLEVAAVLDKVDSLKTTGAKRRRLEEALAAIQADEIADFLQEKQIAALTQALVELEQDD